MQERRPNLRTVILNDGGGVGGWVELSVVKLNFFLRWKFSRISYLFNSSLRYGNRFIFPLTLVKRHVEQRPVSVVKDHCRACDGHCFHLYTQLGTEPYQSQGSIAFAKRLTKYKMGWEAVLSSLLTVIKWVVCLLNWLKTDSREGRDRHRLVCEVVETEIVVHPLHPLHHQHDMEVVLCPAIRLASEEWESLTKSLHQQHSEQPSRSPNEVVAR